MTPSAISRRTLLRQGSAAVAGLSVLRVAGPTAAFQTPVAGEVIPWLDQPEPNPAPGAIVRQLEWEQLDSWITPNDQFFVIKHFNEPELTENDWRLDISGLVDQPLTLTLDDLKARERQEVTCHPGVLGQHRAAVLQGGHRQRDVGRHTAGAAAGGSRGFRRAHEVVFWGADAGEQTWREMTITEQFARCMALQDAAEPGQLARL